MTDRPNGQVLEEKLLYLTAELEACRKKLALLAESEKMYRQLIEETDELVMRFDGKGRIRYANRAAEKIIGLKFEAQIGRLAFDFVHPEDRRNTQAAFDGWINDRVSSLTFENRLINQANQQVHYMLWTITLSYDQQSRLTGINAIAKDMTKRKESEIELQQLTHQLQERVKELNCLYRISRLREKHAFSLDEVIQRIVEIIPDSMQYPDITCVRVAFDGYAYQTKNYRTTASNINRDVTVNNERVCTLEVGYLDLRPEGTGSAFAEEEHHLIGAVAEQLGIIIEREWAEIELRRHREHLEMLLNTRTRELERSAARLDVEIRRRRAAESALMEVEDDE